MAAYVIFYMRVAVAYDVHTTDFRTGPGTEIRRSAPRTRTRSHEQSGIPDLSLHGPILLCKWGR